LKRMKILYLAHRIPYPPNKGEKIRSFLEIQSFARNHEVHLVAFCDNVEDANHAGAMSRYCASATTVRMFPGIQSMRALFAMLAGRPWTLGYFWNPEMSDIVRRLTEKHSFDLAFAYSSSVAPYVSELPIPKIVDFVDSDAAKWRQYARERRLSYLYSYEADHLAAFERRMLDKFDHCVFVSAGEASHFPESRKLHFISNGIDLEFFRPAGSCPSGHSIIFTGAMNYYPNVDAVSFFAEDVLPRVRRRVSDARFLVVGSRPTAAVRRLARLAGVVVNGSVPDVRPYFAEAKLAVVPMRIAQGIQNKLLEALAMGLPVVTTPAVARRVDAVESMPVLVEADPERFADRVVEQLLAPCRTPAQIRETREVLARHYDWSKNLSKFEELFDCARQ
jgi:sugar transferase (PEP-CTERM/EpsH1 system associated)